MRGRELLLLEVTDQIVAGLLQDVWRLEDRVDALERELAYVSILESRLTVARNALGNIAGMCVDELPYPEIDDYAMTTRAAIDTEKDS